MNEFNLDRLPIKGIQTLEQVKNRTKIITENRIKYTEKQYENQKIDSVNDNVNKVEKSKQINELWNDYENQKTNSNPTREERSGETGVARSNRELFENANKLNPENVIQKKQSERKAKFKENTLDYLETKNGKEVFYLNENVEYFNTEDLELIAEDIAEDGTAEEQKKVEQLLRRQTILDDLGDTARKLFRNMLTMEKGTEERVAAYEEWMNARNELIGFEKLSLDKIFEDEVSDPSEVENDDREYIPGEVA